MDIAYICGPYRASTPSGIVANIRRAEAISIEYWCKGYAVICPHKNTALFDGLADDGVWLEGAKEFIRRMIPGRDVVVMVPGWEDSEGSKDERSLAMDLGIKIIYWREK